MNIEYFICFECGKKYRQYPAFEKHLIKCQIDKQLMKGK